MPLQRRLFAGAVSVLLYLAATSAQAVERRELVEAILSRALLERGAMLACAQMGNAKEETDVLSLGWKKDLADAEKLLRELGYAENYVRTLSNRFALDIGTPKFSDRVALTRFCTMLGDWKTRYFHLMLTLPDMELKRALRR